MGGFPFRPAGLATIIGALPPLNPIDAARFVLQMIAEGRFSPDEPGRYHGLVHRVWHHDYFLVAADFAVYHAAQVERKSRGPNTSRRYQRGASNERMNETR